MLYRAGLVPAGCSIEPAKNGVGGTTQRAGGAGAGPGAVRAPGTIAASAFIVSSCQDLAGTFGGQLAVVDERVVIAVRPLGEAAGAEREVGHQLGRAPLQVVQVDAPHAALAPCSAPPGAVTGRIAYSMELLGRPFAEGPWALSATY